jgi:DNA-binding response OmpR family regulator/signal transduction histidine kinase
MVRGAHDNTSQHEILVVDDDPISLQVLSRILAKHGYQVRTAGGGLDALHAVAVKAPDLILLDVMMPEIGGHEVCRRLKSDAGSCDIPVLFVSALGEPAEKVEGFKAGCQDYIHKPYSPAEVLARVKVHLRLNELNKRLEQKVIERTNELAAASLKIQQELVERRKAEQIQAFHARRAEALLALPKLMESMDEGAFIERGQQLAEELTGSRISFIHFVNEDEKTIELASWSRNTLEHFCHAACSQHATVGEAGIWADALRQRRPAIFNDYAAYPHKHGLPPGHSKLDRLISIPVIEKGRVVMVAGVGNKASDYDALDVETVQLIFNDTLRIVKRKRAETDLVSHLQQLDELVESRTAELRAARDDAEAANITMSALLDGLQVSEERLKLAQHTVGFGIFYRDDVAVNPPIFDARAQEIFGFNPDETTTFEMFMDCIHPDDRERLQALIDQARIPTSLNDYSKESQAEYRIIRRTDGKVLDIKGLWIVYFEQGQHVRTLGVLWDITEQKLSEWARRDQLAKMDLFIRQQVAVHTVSAIAHELNQPLVSISAFSEAALDMLQSGAAPPHKIERALQGAVEQAHRAGGVLHELLAHLHKGSEGEKSLVDLNALVQEEIAITSMSDFDEFTMVLELEQTLPPVMANGLQLQKVLGNLLINSIDVLRARGKPKAANSITVRTFAAGNMAHVTVQDSGPGLSEEIAARIFDPFISFKPDGMGLGLVVSRALVEANGGQLWADLDAGPGAMFRFTVPIVP